MRERNHKNKDNQTMRLNILNKWNEWKQQEWFRQVLQMKLKLSYELTLFILALISLSTMLAKDPDYIWIDRTVYAIFLLDILVRLYLAPKKWEYIKKNPLDMIVALPLDSLFQSARILRFLRLIRILMMSTRFMRPIYAVIKENQLERTITFAFLLIFVVSIPISLVEPNINEYGDAIWWSIVTMTTVGYGDISPETGLGRTLAVLLMLVGIGVIGMVTGSIASYLIGNQQAQSLDEMKYLQSKLKRYPNWSPEDVVLMKEMIDKLAFDQEKHQKDPQS